MNKVLCLFGLIALFAMPSSLWADPLGPTDPTDSLVTLQSIGTGWGGEGIYIDGTVGTVAKKFLILTGTPQKSDMLALLLFALSSGRNVALHFNGKNNANVPYVSSVYLQ